MRRLIVGLSAFLVLVASFALGGQGGEGSEDMGLSPEELEKVKAERGAVYGDVINLEAEGSLRSFEQVGLLNELLEILNEGLAKTDQPNIYNR